MTVHIYIKTEYRSFLKLYGVSYQKKNGISVIQRDAKTRILHEKNTVPAHLFEFREGAQDKYAFRKITES